MIKRKKRACVLFLILSLALISLSSLCKKSDDDDYLEPTNVSNNSGRSESPSIAVDSKNTVHLVWDDDTPGNKEIFYAYKPADGNWSTPVNLSNNSQSSRYPCIKVDRNDNLHLVWQDCSPDGYWRIFYINKSPNQNWSVPETIAGNWQYVDPKIVVDDSNDIHLIWEYGSWYSGIRYATRNTRTGWSEQVDVISYPQSVFNPSLTITQGFDLYIVWSGFSSDSSGDFILCTKKQLNGVWTTPDTISNPGGIKSSPIVVADRNNDVHFIWDDNFNFTVTHGTYAYRTRYANGLWSAVEPCTLFTNNLPGEKDFASSPNNILYLVWSDFLGGAQNTICCIKRMNIGWTEMESLAKFNPGPITLAVDANEKIYFACSGSMSMDNQDIYYFEKKGE